MADAPYLTATQVRDRQPNAGLDAVSDTVIAQVVSEFEDIAERFTGVTWTPRTNSESRYLFGDTALQLLYSPLRSITTFTIDSTAVASTEYLLDLPSSILRFYGWRIGQMEITYSYGGEIADQPETLLRACAQYVRQVVASENSGTSRNIIGQSMDGSYIRYSTPDWSAGRPTGWLDVDRLLTGIMDRSPWVA